MRSRLSFSGYLTAATGPAASPETEVGATAGLRLPLPWPTQPACALLLRRQEQLVDIDQVVQAFRAYRHGALQAAVLACRIPVRIVLTGARCKSLECAQTLKLQRRRRLAWRAPELQI